MNKFKSYFISLLLGLPCSAFGLALGDISVASFLNEPFKAEVAIEALGDVDPNHIIVRSADPAEFRQADLEFTYLANKLKYMVTQNSQGQDVVAISSDVAIKEPYVEILLKTSWAGGHLLKAYTVLLDPPAFTQVANSNATKSTSVKPTHEDNRQTKQGSVSGQTYGPIKSTDTLWSIAKRLRPSADVSVPQAMARLIQHNPKAFVNGDANRMLTGFYLAWPGSGSVVVEQTAVIEKPKPVADKEGEANVAAVSDDNAAEVAKPKATDTVNSTPLTEDATNQVAKDKAVPTVTDVQTEIAIDVPQAGLSIVTPVSESPDMATSPGDALFVGGAEGIDFSVWADNLATVEQKSVLNEEGIDALKRDQNAIRQDYSQLFQELDALKVSLEKAEAIANKYNALESELQAISAQLLELQARPAGVSDESFVLDKSLVMTAIVVLVGLFFIMLVFLLLMAKKQRQAEAFYTQMALAEVDDSSLAAAEVDDELNLAANEQNKTDENTINVESNNGVVVEELASVPEVDMAEESPVEVKSDVPAEVEIKDNTDANNSPVDESLEILLSETGLGGHKGAVMTDTVAPAQSTETDMLDLSDDETSTIQFATEASTLPPAEDAAIDLETFESPSTKLDLARAFIDMKDLENARLMLEEVLKEGDEQLKKEADQLLKRIA